jgi:hypothetical protein
MRINKKQVWYSVLLCYSDRVRFRDIEIVFFLYIV